MKYLSKQSLDGSEIYSLSQITGKPGVIVLLSVLMEDLI